MDVIAMYTYLSLSLSLSLSIYFKIGFNILMVRIRNPYFLGSKEMNYSL